MEAIITARMLMVEQMYAEKEKVYQSTMSPEGPPPIVSRWGCTAPQWVVIQ